MKKTLFLIFAVGFSTAVSAKPNDSKKINISQQLVGVASKKIVAPVNHVTLDTWCGVLVKYDYTPADGMTEQQIDSEIAFINHVIEQNFCPPTHNA